jgi:hypothetical protein
MNSLDDSVLELQRQIKKSELKLRQITHTKLKDLQRAVKDRDDQIRELKSQVATAKFGGKSMERASSSQALQGLTRINSSGSRSGYKRQNYREPRGPPIHEVDEDLERTGAGYFGTEETSRRPSKNRGTPVLPLIGNQYSSMQDLSNSRTVSAHKLKQNHPNVERQYQGQFESYEHKRKDPAFYNGSSAMSGVLSSG